MDPKPVNRAVVNLDIAVHSRQADGAYNTDLHLGRAKLEIEQPLIDGDTLLENRRRIDAAIDDAVRDARRRLETVLDDQFGALRDQERAEQRKKDEEAREAERVV